MDERPLLVTIRCLIYNHEPYIRQCLDGFVMQKTNFRFEAIVHDDASTDNSAAIIREYAEKYPDIIKPIFETENQYSKHDDSLRKIMDSHMHGKYIAFCEGDDYWTDPYKLQIQVDFMESHPEHTVCFCAHEEEYSDGSKKEVHRYNRNMEECPVEDAIRIGGEYMATCSQLYSRDAISNRPVWSLNLPIGDAPQMLVLLGRGKCGYINKPMVTYRVNTIGSWSNRMKYNKREKRHLLRSVINMYKGFDKWTEKKYHKVVTKRIILIRFNELKSYFCFW